MAEHALEFTSNNFQSEVLDADLPVLVDFWAEWCGPCKMLTPTINEIADEYKETAVIGKLNVDQNPSIASEYGIRSIPSLLFFKKGKVQSQIVGGVSKSEIKKTLDSLINDT